MWITLICPGPREAELCVQSEAVPQRGRQGAQDLRLDSHEMTGFKVIELRDVNNYCSILTGSPEIKLRKGEVC